MLDAKCAVGRSGTKYFDQNFLDPNRAINVSSGIVVTSKPYARLLFVTIAMMSFETEFLVVLRQMSTASLLDTAVSTISVLFNGSFSFKKATDVRQLMVLFISYDRNVQPRQRFDLVR